MKKSFTFVVLDNGKHTTKKYTLSYRRLAVFGSLGALGLLLVGLLVFDYASLLTRSGRGQFLVQQNRNLKGEISHLASKMTSVEKSLQRLGVYTRKLNLITKTNSPNRDIELSQEDEATGFNFVVPLERVKDLTDDPELVSLVLPGLEVRMKHAQESSQLKEQNLLNLWQRLEDRIEILAATPSMSPTDGWVTSRFGYRKAPFGGRKSMHHGLDIAANFGTPVKAPASGVVSYVGYDGGYGNLVSIDHGFGVVTRYGHNAKILVKYGQRVERGHVIAEVGNTGRSTGPHLHYEVRINGVAVNPSQYILEEEVL